MTSVDRGLFPASSASNQLAKPPQVGLAAQVDLILSSGYLALPRHVGVLRELEQRNWTAEAVVGTSSGAVIGALYASGMSAEEITRFVASRRPAAGFGLARRPWRGLLHLGPFQRLLAQVLPNTFEQLPLPLAVGVRDGRGRHRLICSGPLVAAVAASAAVPGLFQPVELNGQPCADGGSIDRVGVNPWRSWRPECSALVHEVQRSRGAVGRQDYAGLTVIRTQRARASLLTWNDFEAQASEAQRDARRQLNTSWN